MPRGKKKVTKSKESSANFSLTEELESFIATENLGGATEYNPTYDTGIDMIDYRLAKIEEDEILLGLNGGKIFTMIGPMGSGKTTLEIQIALFIIHQYENAQLIYLDYENAGNKARVYSLAKKLGITKAELDKKLIYLNTGLYSETLYKITKGSAKLKLANYENIKIDTGTTNKEGNPIYALPPTIILIDSWARVIPKDIEEEEELSGFNWLESSSNIA